MNCAFKDDENFGKKFTSNQRKFYKSRQFKPCYSYFKKGNCVQIFECKDANRNCLKSQIDLFKIFRLSKFLVNCTFKDDENFGKNSPNQTNVNFTNQDNLNLVIVTLKKDILNKFLSAKMPIETASKSNRPL